MRILLIEDEEKVIRFVSHGLKAAGFAVDSARNGVAGLEAAAKGFYDLVVVDLALPGLCGTEVIARLRLRNAEVAIVVLTARDAVADKVANFEAGADDYITKPFSFAELLVRIQALLRRGSAHRTNVLRIANLEVDRLAHQVKRAGVPVKLTSKEYSLLEYLAMNSGRVLSRTMILEHVWDESFEGLTNIVDVYIRQLRRKIDESHPGKLIHTVRRVGYSLGSEAAV